MEVDGGCGHDGDKDRQRIFDHDGQATDGASGHQLPSTRCLRSDQQEHAKPEQPGQYMCEEKGSVDDQQRAKGHGDRGRQGGSRFDLVRPSVHEHGEQGERNSSAPNRQPPETEIGIRPLERQRLAAGKAVHAV
jgi:hypothetical protein